MITADNEKLVFDTRLMEARDYWAKRLRDELWTSGLEDLPSGAHGPVRFEHVVREAVSARVRAIAGSSSFLTFVAAAAGLILCFSRHSGKSAIGIATPAMKGAKPNLVPVLAYIDPQATAKEFLVTIRASLLESYSRQNLPFSHLLGHLDVDLSEPSLFDVVLEFPGMHEMSPAFEPKLRVSLRSELPLLADFSFIHSAVPFNAEALSSQWEQAVWSIVSNLDGKLSDIILSSPQENEQLASWSDGGEPQSHYEPTLALIKRNVVNRPNAPAIFCGKSCWSFWELDARSRRIARLLQLRGAGPEKIIGVLMNRSPELVSVLLAIWQTGAAFLPLDPADPPQRMQALLLDGSITLTVTSHELADRLEGATSELLIYDEKECFSANEDHYEPCGYACPETLAYLIYTSGSTGQPKGVMVTHAGLSNYLRYCINAYGSAGRQSSFLHTSISFDLSLTSLFLPLVAGSSIIIAPLGADGLIEALRSYPDAGVLKIAPAHLALLVEELKEGRIHELEGDLVIGGEALSWHAAQTICDLCPSAQLFNEYGPTETVVGCCVEKLQGDLGGLQGDVPIGRPISGARVWVLDEEMRPAPIGVLGEIYIGGIGVARGYWAKPADTALKFIPDPLTTEPGKRLYRTGDRGYYLPDGRIAFAGRRDEQVKIRGYRVELGEVEQALMQHPAVRRAVVLARTKGSTETLTAYCLSTDDVSLKDWREFLSVRLPGYMIPGVLRVVENIPLSTNGKVNRAALLALDDGRQTLKESRAPNTEIERRLVVIWCELMERKDIGIDDDFFELGGHSLFATQMLSRIRRALHVDLPLRIIFESPTIAELAKVIEVQAASQIAEEMTIERQPRNWGSNENSVSAAESQPTEKASGGSV